MAEPKQIKEKSDKFPETDTKNEIAQLRREIELLKEMFWKDNFIDKQIFRKNIEFKQPVDLSIGTIADITDILKTGGVAPKVDGTVTFDKTTDTTIAITTINGIVTAITKT